MAVNEIICSNIVTLRKKHGLSQEALASRLGVTFQAVSKWENNLSCPDIALIPEIADVFQVSVDYLFGREEKTGKERETGKIHKDMADWPDDENLYAVVFQGHRLLKEQEIDSRLSSIQFEHSGPVHDISSCFSVTIKGDIAIRGSNISAGSHISCADIFNSNVISGTHLSCRDITGADKITAGAHIQAGNITCNMLTAGSHITCQELTTGNVMANSVNFNKDRK